MGIATVLRDALFPGRCAGCGKIGSWLCLACKKRIKPNLPECYICRRLSPHYITHEKCQSNSNFYLNRLIILWQYDEVISKIMSTYKFSRAYSINETVSALLATQEKLIHSVNSADIIIPMPLHPKRVVERGFNPVVRICESIKTEAQIHAKVDSSIISRSTNNPHQAFVKKGLRNKNVANIFTATKELEKEQIQEILIVDDVITTGATMNSLAKTLHNAFPWVKLSGLCLFRGKPNYKDICYNPDKK